MKNEGLEEFKVKGVALVKEVRCVYSAVEVFQSFKDHSHAAFLDSSLIDERQGRYSFVVFDPFLTLKCFQGELIVSRYSNEMRFTGDLFVEIRKLLDEYEVENTFGGIPFIGGAIGYFSYDLKHYIEKLPSHSVNDLVFPDCYICMYDSVIIFDHINNKSYISCCYFPESNGVKNENDAERKIAEIERQLQEPLERDRISDFDIRTIMRQQFSNKYGLNWNYTKEEYISTIKKAIEYILAGDIFQVNLSQRFHTKLKVPPWQLYKYLHHINPVPFGNYLDFKEIVILGASPESFLKLRGRHVETRPMKGTRPRGRTLEEGMRLKKDLVESVKDKAELAMIVDMERNDLGRVCELGSIKVSEPRVIETYETVYQTTGTVEGTLRSDKDRMDLLKACFPGGSITGAPKVRAMEIIDELEPTRRSVYTGSVGYLSFSGEMHLNIVIRTILIKNDMAYFQVGGGILADSIPEKEYEETLDKARALLYTIETAQKAAQGDVS